MLRVTLLLFAFLVSACTSPLFHPSTTWLHPPSQVGLGYEDVILVKNSTLRLHAWWLPAAGSQRGTVLFLHNGEGNISGHLSRVNWLPGSGFNVLMLDYEGYGLSEGRASVATMADDVQLGLEWLSRHKGQAQLPLIVLGQGLGASVTVSALAREPHNSGVQCAVLDGAYPDYREAERRLVLRSGAGFRAMFFDLLLPHSTAPPVKDIGKLSIPLLIVESNESPVARTDAATLYDAATLPKELYAARLDEPGPSAYQQRLGQFFIQHCNVTPQPSVREPGAPSVPATPANRSLRF